MKFNIKSFIIISATAMGLLAGSMSCGSGNGNNNDSDVITTGDAATQACEGEKTSNAARPTKPVGTEPRHNARFRTGDIGPLHEVFNDSNKYQYAAAEKIGIKPVTNLHDAYHTARPLVKIETCDAYYVDSLTHSMPYLVPEAADLLRTIGYAFIDSLYSRGVDGYKIKVTSLLRTAHTVKRLRRINVNSTDSSTHMLGTTFDISWSKFYCENPDRTLHDGDMKILLAEVLRDLRHQGRCMVKYERKTACFHVSAIK